jgi:4-aminobutyrate aminotransferase/(S)-3-amino-2-methylpropionate transaminase
MRNQAPGSPNLSILSFKGGFHGRTLGALSTTRSKDIHKIDIPAFNWPAASFPKFKYPLDAHAKENAAEEKKSLEEVEHLIKTWPVKVAGLIVEPIQSEGGDNHASPAFFRALRQLTKKHGVAFIVDEVQTGGGPTGAFWAHSAWNLESPPEIVTFSKKLQAAGFYHNMDFRPNAGYRNFNTWLGDPLRALQLKTIVQQISEQQLLKNVTVTGQFMLDGLSKIAAKYPVVQNVRGIGTFAAFDLPSPKARDDFVTLLRNNGLQCSGCGVQSVRIRPMLIFAPRHAAQFLDIVEKSLQQSKL